MTQVPPPKHRDPRDDDARTEESKRIIEEYAADLREILQRLARRLN
jgi:hypothetical protein